MDMPFSRLRENPRAVFGTPERPFHRHGLPVAGDRDWGETLMGVTCITVLSQDEIDAVREASLQLLEEVGVLVREDRAMRLLLGAGATRTNEADCVLLPGSLVREALAVVPKRWTWHARSRRNDLHIGSGERTRLGPGSACTRFIDFETGETRAPTVHDGDRLVRLMDALEYVDINYTPVTLDVSEGSTSYHEVSTMVRDLQNTSKVLVGPSFNGSMARDGLEIAKILAGGEESLRKTPMIAGYNDPVGPLIHDRAMTEVLIEYAAMGQPVFLTCLDLAGASAPPTLAGTLVQQNAEILSGVVIAYLVNRRAPLVYGSVGGVLDMRAGNAALGGPEFGLLSVASIQLAHSYGLPCTAGGQSDAKIHDAQASLEKATTLLSSVLAGADFVDLFFGSFEGYGTTSLEQVIIDQDIAGYAFRYRDGIEVNEETMGLKLFGEVGAGGSFLKSRKALEYTMARMKKEYYFPKILDRRPRDAAHAMGKSLLAEAHARAARILADHQPDPLDSGMLKEMNAALEHIRKRSVMAGAS